MMMLAHQQKNEPIKKKKIKLADLVILLLLAMDQVPTALPDPLRAGTLRAEAGSVHVLREPKRVRNRGRPGAGLATALQTVRETKETHCQGSQDVGL